MIQNRLFFLIPEWLVFCIFFFSCQWPHGWTVWVGARQASLTGEDNNITKTAWQLLIQKCCMFLVPLQYKKKNYSKDVDNLVNTWWHSLCTPVYLLRIWNHVYYTISIPLNLQIPTYLSGLYVLIWCLTLITHKAASHAYQYSTKNKRSHAVRGSSTAPISFLQFQ